jgi:hypothetical protein
MKEKDRAKHLANVEPLLTAGEEIKDVTSGMVQVRRMGSDTKRACTVAVTDRRVIVWAKKMGGYDLMDLHFDLISSVDHKRGVSFGNLDLAAAGDRVHISMVPKEDVERVANEIREQRGKKPESAAPVQASPADQVRQLAQLRDEGLLTEEEFDRKQKELLGL